MKAEFDKDIDSLLRESARRGRAASVEPDARAAADGALHAAHLDADEQSAYAENALPAAARAHYAAHLADCDDCRRNVTRLALAAGVPAQLEPRETAAEQAVPANVNWRERLGALFAPRAWRYAVPALALLLVGVVTFIVLTRKPREEAANTTIARRNPQEAQRPQAAQPEAHHAQQNDNTTATTSTAPGGEGVAVAPNAEASASNPNVSPAREEIAANSERAEVAQPVTGTTLNDVATPPPPAPSTGSGAVARAITEFPTPMPTPAPAVDELTITSAQEAKAKSGAPAPELRKLEQRTGDFENRQYEDRQREKLSGPRRNEQARNTRPANTDDARADRRGGNVGATASAPTATAAARRSRQPEADRRGNENRPAEDLERSERASAKSVAETRTVAGRKFRRQDNAWVDTAYRSGQSYTVVRRGSEQFRALAADEPELRRIADALGGEVTVIWKGRAYRIR